MDAARFLGRAVPDNGYIYVGRLNKHGGFWHTAFDHGAYDEVARHMAREAHKDNVYIALAGFRDKLVDYKGKMVPRRAVENVAYMRCFFADMDCGPDKPSKDKVEALGRVVEFVKAGKIPRPSMVIDSGGGIHIYWCLDEPLPVDEWQPIASALKTYLLSIGLGIDQAVTADAARVLRAPDTINHKRNKRVRALKLDGPDYTPDDIKEYLGDLPMLTKRHGAVDVDEFSAGVVAGKRGPVYMARIAERCPAMADVLATHGANQSEPYWMATLHLASFCEDGRQMAHEMSRGYSGYNHAQTDRKFDQRLEVDRDEFGPTTCSAISNHSLACATCQYRETIKTPIVLGNPSRFPMMPAGFRFDGGRLVRLVEERDDAGNASITTRQVTWFQIDNMELITEDGITSIAVTWRTKEKAHPRVTLIQLGDLADDRTFGRVAHAEGMSLQTAELKDYRVFMVAFSTLLQMNSEPVQQQAPFGWAPEPGKKWFGVGDVAYIPGGEEPINIGRSRSIIAHYAASGSIDEWRIVSDFLCTQGHAPLLAIYASAFAAPLMDFIGLPGVLVSAMSPGSGVGKTSALSLGASVYGDPMKTVHAVDDTPNMISRKMSMTSGLPAYWDELRVKNDMHALVKHVFRITQGKDKSRLRADTSFNMGRSWSTMMLVCSNTSLFDYVLRDGGGAAGFYRVFEFEVTPPPQQRVDQMVGLFSKLRKHHGHAGRVYARYLVDHYDEVKARCEQVREDIVNKVDAANAERFWCGTIAALVVGAELANDAGLTTFNTSKLQAYLLAQFNRLRAMQYGELAEELDEVNALADFLARSVGNTLITDTVWVAPGRPIMNQMPRIKKHPTKELTIQIGLDDGKTRISATAFRDYLRDRGMAQSATLNGLIKKGAISEKFKGSLGAGTIYSPPARGFVYDLQPGFVDVDSIYAGDITEEDK